MVAIKDMEMQTNCKKCPFMGTDGNPKDLFSPMMCVALWATTHEINHCIEGRVLDNCPLVEIEERKVGKWVIDDKEGYRIWHCHCSICKKDPQDYIGGSENWWLVRLPNYCPNCSAEMVGAENE